MNWMSLRQVTYLYLSIAPILGLILEGSITVLSSSVVFVAGMLFFYETYSAYDRWKSDREHSGRHV